MKREPLVSERDWATATDPLTVLLHLRLRGASERKARLFAVASVRRVGDMLTQAAREGLVVAERLADGEVAEAGRKRARRLVSEVVSEDVSTASYRRGVARRAVSEALRQAGWQAADGSARCIIGIQLAERYEAEGQGRDANAVDADAALLALARDIFGHLLNPVSFDPSWRTEAVVALARGIYEERVFERLPVLADALEDAGCSDEAVLAHCRGDWPHHRGCWVVDEVLLRN